MPTPEQLTIPDKLDSINVTKQAIRQAIVDKGVDVPEGTTFYEYAGKIGEISGGGEWIQGEISSSAPKARGGFVSVDAYLKFPPFQGDGNFVAIIKIGINDNNPEYVGYLAAYKREDNIGIKGLSGDTWESQAVYQCDNDGLVIFLSQSSSIYTIDEMYALLQYVSMD